MNSPEQVALNIGAAHFSPPPLRAVKGFSLTFEQLQAFADHYRKEGAEEANKTHEAEKSAWENLNNQVCTRNEELHRQLAATELVVEQMREGFEKIGDEGITQAQDDLIKKVMALQPSLSALRERESKVLEDAVRPVIRTYVSEREARFVFASIEARDEFMGLMVAAKLASELRAKGDK